MSDSPERPIVSVLLECKGRTYRVIDNLRELVGGEADRIISELKIGRKILDPARFLDAEMPFVPSAGKPERS